MNVAERSIARAEGSVMAENGAEVRDEQSASDIVDDEVLTDDLLIEEISIDGMCGVY
jgi:mycofactocin precursor